MNTRDIIIFFVMIGMCCGLFRIASTPRVTYQESVAVIEEFDGYREQYVGFIPRLITIKQEEKLDFWDALANLLFIYVYGIATILIGSIVGIITFIKGIFTSVAMVFQSLGIILGSWFLPAAIWFSLLQQPEMTYGYFATMLLLGWPTLAGPLFLIIGPAFSASPVYGVLIIFDR